MSSTPRQSESLGSFEPLVEEAIRHIKRENTVWRIWDRDASVWRLEESHQQTIRNSLGWLTVAQAMTGRVEEIEGFAREVRESNFTHVILLGMGGSSLCPEVFRRTLGKIEGFPELLVLDSTDPDTIADLAERAPLEQTLFIVSSKSGTTVEPNSLYKYFLDRVRNVRGERAGENFIAITDPGTALERESAAVGFRRVFLNPPDIGGRYSALSLFGLVPAALMGLDLHALLSSATKAMNACGWEAPIEDNQAARLGCVMGSLARAGRDKLTLITDKSISALGLWVEQLVAESTGKEGAGIVPIAGEALGAPDSYADDRLFVAVYDGRLDAETDRKLDALIREGHPVVRRALANHYVLGAEFFIWELATAVAGAILEINPFDQPNVQESKNYTVKLLDTITRSGKLPEQTPIVSEGDLSVYAVKEFEESAKASVSSVIGAHLASVKVGDYVAFLAYIQETSAHDELLESVRTHMREATHVATTAGYGPRYLHSTGQLHKGGRDNGVFIILTDDDRVDFPVPGESYTFSALKQAQALGDFSALADHKRRVIRLHLGRDATAGLEALLDIVSKIPARVS